MFKALRKMILPIIIIVLVFFGGLIIFEWGAGLSSRRDYESANLAGIVNGEEITWQIFQRTVSNMHQMERERSGGDISDIRAQEIRLSAWSQLVTESLMRQQAQKYSITVSDDELYAYLRMSPPADLQQIQAFQTNGQFDYQKYLSGMADPQAAGFWRSIEPAIKDDISRLKLQEIIVQAALITEPEVKHAFISEQEKIKVGYVNVALHEYTAAVSDPEDEELSRYYTEHSDKYATEEQAAFQYVSLKDEPTNYDWQLILDDIKPIYDSAMAGSDFAELAKQQSQDGSAPEGGDLGFFAEGEMVPEFDSVVFALKDGDISEPFKTRFGWHFVKHHGYKTEDGKRKAHVSHILRRIEVSPRTLEEIQARLESFRAQVAGGEDFATLAKTMQLNAGETAPFPRGPSVGMLGEDLALNDFAFEGQIGDISDIRIGRPGYSVARISRKLPAGIPPLEDVKTRVTRDWRNEKAAVICRDTAQAVYDVMAAGASLSEAASKIGREYVTSNEFTRKRAISGVGMDPRAVGGAFSLAEIGNVSKPIDHNQGCVIFELLEKSTLDLTTYNEAHDSIADAVLTDKRQRLYNDWYQQLIEQSEIINFVDRVQPIDTTM